MEFDLNICQDLSFDEVQAYAETLDLNINNKTKYKICKDIEYHLGRQPFIEALAPEEYQKILKLLESKELSQLSIRHLIDLIATVPFLWGSRQVLLRSALPSY